MHEEERANMREVIKKDRVQLVEGDRRGAPRAPLPGLPGHASHPSVRLVDLGPGTKAIEYTCACGEISLLEVELAPPQPPRNSP
jgi:hypothetical protein